MSPARTIMSEVCSSSNVITRAMRARQCYEYGIRVYSLLQLPPTIPAPPGRRHRIVVVVICFAAADGVAPCMMKTNSVGVFLLSLYAAVAHPAFGRQTRL